VRGPSAAHRHIVDLSIEDRDHLQQATVQCPGLEGNVCQIGGIEAALSGQQYEVATPSLPPPSPRAHAHRAPRSCSQTPRRPSCS
jgi:hypothetical protein